MHYSSRYCSVAVDRAAAYVAEVDITFLHSRLSAVISKPLFEQVVGQYLAEPTFVVVMCLSHAILGTSHL